jgi:hypothetical protein
MLDEPLTDAAGLDAWEAEDRSLKFWVPRPGVTNHNGEPLPPDRVFFAPPPPEIGEVVTAYSTLTSRSRPMSPLSRALLSVGVGSAVAVGLSFVPDVDVVFEVLAFVVAAPLVWLATGFRHKATYVGLEGVARLSCQGSLDRPAKAEVFRFDEAEELRTGQTRQYNNGVYSGTSYHFTWTDAQGRKRYKLSGTYHGEKKPPKAKDPFHFAKSAERAWSHHKGEWAAGELESTGAVRFNLGGSDWIAVGEGFLILGRKGTEERWDAGEIGGISVRDGVLKIKRVDAKEGWFSSHGVFQVSLASMADARLFLLTIEKLLGVPFC